MRLRLTATFFTVMLTSAIHAQTGGTGCAVTFQVVVLDRLGNYDTGVPQKSLKDVEKRLSKHPGVCYLDSNRADLVFFIHTTPATYHGHHIYTNNSSSAAAVSDGNGGAAAAAASSSSTTAVPYDVDYSVFILDIEVAGGDGSYRVLHTFDQKGLYNTIYGIGYGKGKHPIPNVIEAAAAWSHDDLPRILDELTAAKTAAPAKANTQSAKADQSLTIECNVAGADIEIDGAFVGSTPSTVSVTPGSHTIAVKKKGYADWSRTMNVAGSGVRVNAELEIKP